jgi:bacterioferritin-associated ferredoxin
MIVCVCHRVSGRDIARAARHGCAKFDELQEQLRVGTACGACARATFNDAQRGPTRSAVAGPWIAIHAALTSARPAPQPAAAS